MQICPVQKLSRLPSVGRQGVGSNSTRLILAEQKGCGSFSYLVYDMTAGHTSCQYESAPWLPAVACLKEKDLDGNAHRDTVAH